jgi:hypothetical protein
MVTMPAKNDNKISGILLYAAIISPCLLPKN